MEEKKKGFFSTLKQKIRDKLGIKTKIIKVPAAEGEPAKTFMKTPAGRMEIRPDGTIVLFHGSLTPKQEEMNEKVKDVNLNEKVKDVNLNEKVKDVNLNEKVKDVKIDMHAGRRKTRKRRRASRASRVSRVSRRSRRS
jgi:hypothetical protein